MKKRKQIIVSSTVLEFYEIFVDENTDYEDVIEEFYRIDSPEPYRTDSINWEVISVDAFD